jgi:hypothetical protein
LAKISSGLKTLDFCDISRNSQSRDSMADTRAFPGGCWAEIPPEFAPDDSGLATPTACAEAEIQRTTPDAGESVHLGLSFASLGPMEKSAILGIV